MINNEACVSWFLFYIGKIMNLFSSYLRNFKKVEQVQFVYFRMPSLLTILKDTKPIYTTSTFLKT